MPSGLTSWIWTESHGEGPVTIDRCADNGNPAPTWAAQAGAVYVTFQPALRPEDREQTAQVAAQVEESYDIKELEARMAEVEGLTAQVTAVVTAQVLDFCQMPRATEIMDQLGLRHSKSFQRNYLRPTLDAGIAERTIPDKPTSSKQRYQPGPKGKILLENLQPEQS